MVPKGWIATQIGDIAKFSSGGTPSKQNAKFWGGSKPWISGKDLKTHFIGTSIDTLTDEGFQIAKRAPAGASLILVRGMTLLKDFPVGFAIREVAFNQDLKALVPNKNIDGLFLSFLLVSEKHKIKQLVSTAGHGTGRLDTESIKLYPINVPPITEQRKIAQILSTWDKAISVTEKLLANSQQQKNALMQQLLTGKKRLLDENGVRFSGDWVYFSLKHICEFIKDGTHGTHARYESGIPMLSATNITKNGEISFEGAPFISSEDYEKIHAKYRIARHDVLITVVGTIGRVALVETDALFTLQRSVAILRIKEYFSVKFMKQVFSSPSFTSILLQKSNSTAQAGVYLGELMKIKIKIPVFEEQQKVALVLSTADAEIATLEKKLTCLKDEKKALMQQLLTGKRRVKVDAEEAVSA